MRKFVVILLLSILGLFTEVSAQLDKNYFFYVGRSFIIDSKYQDAIETLNILLKTDAKAYEGYFLRGIAKYNLEDLLGAEQDFTLAISYNQVYTMAYQYRAITRSRLGNYDDALKDFQEAIDLRPDLAGPYFSRGVTYLLSQQFEKSISDFTQFIRYEGRVSDAYINRGLANLHLKDTVNAYADFDAAIRINRLNPDSYNRRGSLYMAQKKYDLALADFNKSLECDSTFIPSYFNRALVYSNTRHPNLAIEDFSRIIAIDSTSSLTYFNRAILLAQIGDYNRALADYDKVARYSSNNVLVFYNRAALYTQLGNYTSAISDYSRAIELYPDFANAYLGRASLRYMLNDLAGSKNDRATAESKIAQYRSKLNDSTFSVYADTSKHFNQLLSFESQLGVRSDLEGTSTRGGDIALLPMFKFTLAEPTQSITSVPYYVEREVGFLKELDNKYIKLTNIVTNLASERLFDLDARTAEVLSKGDDSWQALFQRGITQTLIRQYTSAISNYTAAIDRNPSNPFLYLNRSTTQSEMIDFISSIDNSYQRITVESDPANRLTNKSSRTYNYDDAIADLNKASKLFPEYAYIYYNRANLLALSGMMPEAMEDYTKAIELNPSFGEAYYNRGLIQIYLKDTRKGCLDMSKAGELGIQEAYRILKLYSLQQ